jgi:hypothetical protein
MARTSGVNVGALQAAIAEGWQQLAEERLGPEIREDAKRYCPERTGALKDSIRDDFDAADQVLTVSATGGDGGREYAAYVELGHRVFHPSTHRVGPEVVHPEPFLRPALYTERG